MEQGPELICVAELHLRCTRFNFQANCSHQEDEEDWKQPTIICCHCRTVALPLCLAQRPHLEGTRALAASLQPGIPQQLNQQIMSSQVSLDVIDMNANHKHDPGVKVRPNAKVGSYVMFKNPHKLDCLGDITWKRSPNLLSFIQGSRIAPLP